MEREHKIEDELNVPRSGGVKFMKVVTYYGKNLLIGQVARELNTESTYVKDVFDLLDGMQ